MCVRVLPQMTTADLGHLPSTSKALAKADEVAASLVEMLTGRMARQSMYDPTAFDPVMVRLRVRVQVCVPSLSHPTSATPVAL